MDTSTFASWLKVIITDPAFRNWTIGFLVAAFVIYAKSVFRNWWQWTKEQKNKSIVGTQVQELLAEVQTMQRDFQAMQRDIADLRSARQSAVETQRPSNIMSSASAAAHTTFNISFDRMARPASNRYVPEESGIELRDIAVAIDAPENGAI